MGAKLHIQADGSGATDKRLSLAAWPNVTVVAANRFCMKAAQVISAQGTGSVQVGVMPSLPMLLEFGIIHAQSLTRSTTGWGSPGTISLEPGLPSNTPLGQMSLPESGWTTTTWPGPNTAGLKVSERITGYLGVRDVELADNGFAGAFGNGDVWGQAINLAFSVPLGTLSGTIQWYLVGTLLG